MELQLIMDSENITGGSMWLGHSPQPPYHRLSPNRPEVISTQQVSSYHETGSGILWQDKKHSSHEVGKGSTTTPTATASTGLGVKRRIGDQNLSELERKHARREGSVGSSNGSGQAWTSTQVDELAQHLAADFDGPLSALAASDLASAVASYNMSEALLALPSLTVFKQEAPSPEQHTANNVGALEADSNNNNNTSPTTTTTTPIGVPPASISPASTGTAHNSGNRQANLDQLLYSSSDDYHSSSAGNHVSSSSQPGNEFNEDSRFQYVLAAATSIATKLNEETLTYLNQGQSYEIKLKKLGDLSAYRGKILKSNIRICFHERRLQYTEREQMMAWQRGRPGERLLEVDVPLSYGMVDVSQNLTSNSVEFMWDPTKEVGVYIKVNCISTEFTPKKHGGEKGVPFRILVETRLPGGPRLHAASCQVKVFKLKGADRKHKQDRDKILRRPPHEQDKYQPSYDCTVLSDIPLDSLSPPSSLSPNDANSFVAPSNAISPPPPPPPPQAPQQQQPTALPPQNSQSGLSHIENSSVRAAIPSGPINSYPGVLASIGAAGKERERESSKNPGSPEDRNEPIDDYSENENYQLSIDANVAQTSAWLRARRFNAFQATFASFSAQDILRLSRDDLIQICGLADGIRLFNALHSKAPRPKLTLYFAFEAASSVSASSSSSSSSSTAASSSASTTSSSSALPINNAMAGAPATPWRVIYLDHFDSSLLASKILAAINLPRERLHSVLIQGPQGVHVLVTNELVANIKDESMYLVETIGDCASERYKLLLKPSPTSLSPSSSAR